MKINIIRQYLYNNKSLSMIESVLKHAQKIEQEEMWLLDIINTYYIKDKDEAKTIFSDFKQLAKKQAMQTINTYTEIINRYRHILIKEQLNKNIYEIYKDLNKKVL